MRSRPSFPAGLAVDGAGTGARAGGGAAAPGGLASSGARAVAGGEGWGGELPASGQMSGMKLCGASAEEVCKVVESPTEVAISCCGRRGDVMGSRPGGWRGDMSGGRAAGGGDIMGARAAGGCDPCGSRGESGEGFAAGGGDGGDGGAACGGAARGPLPTSGFRRAGEMAPRAALNATAAAAGGAGAAAPPAPPVGAAVLVVVAAAAAFDGDDAAAPGGARRWTGTRCAAKRSAMSFAAHRSASPPACPAVSRSARRAASRPCSARSSSARARAAARRSSSCARAQMLSDTGPASGLRAARSTARGTDLAALQDLMLLRAERRLAPQRLARLRQRETHLCVVCFVPAPSAARRL